MFQPDVSSKIKMLATLCPLARIATSCGSCCVCDEFRISVQDMLLVQHAPIIFRTFLRVFAFASCERNGPNRMLDHFPKRSGRIWIAKHLAVGTLMAFLWFVFFHSVAASSDDALIRKPRVEHRKWQALVFMKLPLLFALPMEPFIVRTVLLRHAIETNECVWPGYQWQTARSIPSIPFQPLKRPSQHMHRA